MGGRDLTLFQNFIDSSFCMKNEVPELSLQKKNVFFQKEKGNKPGLSLKSVGRIEIISKLSHFELLPILSQFFYVTNLSNFQ